MNMPLLPDSPSLDRVGAFFHTLSVNGTLYCQSKLRDPWGVSFPEFPLHAMFHLVLKRRIWLQHENGDGIWIEEGDFCVLPQGLGHAIMSQPKMPTIDIFSLDRHGFNDRFEVLEHGGTGDETLLLCGVIQFNHPTASRFLRAMPKSILVPANLPESSTLIHPLIDAISVEAREPHLGGLEIAEKLTDVLILFALRYWLKQQTTAQSGWISALTHDKIGDVLVLIHQNPGRKWTVAELAREAGLSRASFSDHFTKVVGEPPLTFLTKLRMELACDKLAGTNDTLEVIAEHLGYDSSAAFSHAFKRHRGQSPGQWRLAATRS